MVWLLKTSMTSILSQFEMLFEVRTFNLQQASLEFPEKAFTGSNVYMNCQNSFRRSRPKASVGPGLYVLGWIRINV